MKRRDFIKIGSTVSFSPFVLNKTFAHPFVPTHLLNCYDVEDRILVIIQLNGGNDGLNTLIPISQYSQYANLRPNIGIAQSQYINLDSSLPDDAKVGLHPVMTGIKSLYDSGKVHIVRGTGYPSMNLSHFKSTDLWMTAGDGTTSGFNYTTGWMGRFLDGAFPGLAGNPSSNAPDPLGIQLGSKVPALGFHSNNINPISINLAGQDPAGYFSVVNEIGGNPPSNIPNSDHGTRLAHIINTEQSTSVYANRISSVFNNGSNNGSYPNTYLSNQLKTVARLISGGCKTKIYLVDIFGFDTHVHQTTSNNSPTTGTHANLLSDLSNAVKAFQDDLGSMGLEEQVMTVTFSEFGRKVAENGSRGTDHGTLAPMFIFGKHAAPGMTGVNPDLTNITSNGTLPGLQYDYRRVFATLLQDWLGGTNAMLNDAYLSGYAANKLPLIEPNEVAVCYLGQPLPPAPLAIELLAFRAFLIEAAIVSLEWEAISDHDKDYFEVERSQDGRHFIQIGTVQRGISESNLYEFFDEEAQTGDNYYRLKLVDEQNNFDYSSIELVQIAPSAGDLSLNIFPNPIRNFCQISLVSEKGTNLQMVIINAKSGPMIQQTIYFDQAQQSIKLDTQSWATGTYYLSIFSKEKAINVTKQIIKVS